MHKKDKFPIIGNAAGSCKHLSQLKRLIQAVDVPTIGSIVVPTRPGNEGSPYYRHPELGSVNKLGIPSPGLAYYEENLPLMVEVANTYDKQLAVSIASLTQGDLSILAKACCTAGVDIIEVNEGCGHIILPGGEQKPIPSYDPEQLDQDLSEVEATVTSRMKLRVKLSPYFDNVLIKKVADVLKKHPRYTPVFCNTLANISMLRAEDRTPAIKFTDGLGGHGGSDLFRWIVRGVIIQFQHHLPGRRMIAVGGIRQGVHLFDYLDQGINEMQIGTEYIDTEDPHVFGRIRQEYADILTHEED